MSKKNLPIDTEFIFKHHPNLDRNLIADAFDLCKNHERAVFMTDLIIKSRLGVKSILAAILIDAPEKAIKDRFGQEICDLVITTNKLITLQIPANIKKECENEVATMIVAFAEDVRVLFLAIIYTIYLLECQEVFSKREILNILRFVAPLAYRLNVWSLKMQIEDLCLQRLNPVKYIAIERKLEHLKSQRESYMNFCLDELKKEFKKHSLAISVSGRIKHIYSIYQKIELKKIKFEEIYDLIALRIIVNTIDECYQALGIVHNLWFPQIERIKDYIAVPKPNNYQSIHTTVLGPENQFIEIQIRTSDMDREANFGIAAHWTYAQNKRSTIIKTEQSRWIKSLLALHTENTSLQLDDLKITFYRETVFIFTDKGQVVRLPKGASVIDLAFALSTRTGLCLKGAQINTKEVPLTTILQTADMVKLITNKTPCVQADWLQSVVTPRAIEKIQYYCRKT